MEDVTGVKKIKKKRNKEKKNDVDYTISASDIERFGYCPLSWWLKIQGDKGTGKELEVGIKSHIKVAKDIETIKEKEEETSESETSILLFALIATMLGVNGVAIIYPLYAATWYEEIVSNFLLFISILWIAVALIFFSVSIKRELSLLRLIKKSKPEPKPKPKPKKYKKEKRHLVFGILVGWKEIAVVFIIGGVILAFNGITLFFPVPSEILSRIMISIAMVWLIGTSLALFYALKAEEEKDNKITSTEGSDNDERERSKSITESELLVILFAIGATVLAINGLLIGQKPFIERMALVGQILLVLAMVWLGVSFLFMYKTFKRGIVSKRMVAEVEAIEKSKKEPKPPDIISRMSREVTKEIETIRRQEIAESERGTLYFAAVAAVLGINSILVRYGPHDIFGHIFEIVALTWLIGASFFLYVTIKNTGLAIRLRRIYGFKEGKIEYTDRITKPSEMLVSKIHKLQGRPDYIIRIEDKYIPIELKVGRVPKGPLFSHILQIAAYCILVEAKYEVRPPYGLIKYAKWRADEGVEDEEKIRIIIDRTDEHKIEYTDELKTLLLDKMALMREYMISGEVHRNHNRKGKCRHCSRADSCSERLSD